MAFFTHNLIHSITYSRQGATMDANGDASFGAQSTAPAKVIGKVQQVRGADNAERVSMHTVYTEAEIRIGDRVWLPDLGDDIADASHARRPITVVRSPSLRGTSTIFAVYL